MNNKTTVIAEAGVNHNGNPDYAFQLVDAAVNAGADTVKFQTFKAESIASRHAPKAEYQLQTTDSKESQFDMLKKLELSEVVFKELKQYCQKQNIHFLSTAFDFPSLYFLTDQLGLDTLKIASGEITNAPLILAHAKTKAKLIVSTGMTTLGEIEEALSIIAFGLIAEKEHPSREAFMEAYLSSEGQQALKQYVSLLHCTSNYPASMGSLNLNAMITMRKSFGLPVGYSDHSQGIHVPVAAVALGAEIIEKHYTLDKTMPGPDHLASLEPTELKHMIKNIRDIEKALGDGKKIPSAEEYKTKLVARKSLVASMPIEKGQTYTEHNLTVKRPGTGVQPIRYWEFIQKRAKQNYQLDELIHE